MKVSDFYQEEKVPGFCTFTHEGNEYDLNPLFKLTADFPVFYIPVSKLAWCLDGVALDPERVKAADTSVPILVSPALEGMVPVDGAHRLQKAINMGLTHIPVKFVTPTLLNQVKLSQ